MDLLLICESVKRLTVLIEVFAVDRVPMGDLIFEVKTT